MDLTKGLGLIDMLLSEGCLGIMALMASKKVCRFGDLSKLENPRTLKPFGKPTISYRLRELEASKMVEAKVISSGAKRIVGYSLTEKGRKALRIAERYEEELERL